MQSGLSHMWWPYAATHHCFARNVGLVSGDSSYNRRYQQGHCKAQLMPFGALVNFVPTLRSDVNPESCVSKLHRGLLVGYSTQPGGKWSGDYLVVDFEQLQIEPDSSPSKCSVHRTSEASISASFRSRSTSTGKGSQSKLHRSSA